MVTLNQIIIIGTKILDLLAFICFKLDLSILYMNKVIAKTVSANQNSAFWLYGLLNQILFLTNILGFISFHMHKPRVSIIIFHEVIAKTVLTNQNHLI